MENTHSQQVDIIPTSVTPPSYTLYLALAAPGKGKTEKLIASLPTLLEDGGQVIIALPTLKLCEQVGERISSTYNSDGIGNRTIVVSSNDTNGVPVSVVLSTKLQDSFFDVIICTHVALTMVDPALFKGKTVIIDEVPRAIEYWNESLSEVEQRPLWDYVEASQSSVTIIKGKKTELKERLSAFKSKSNGSTLSKVEHDIYQALIDGVPVYVEDIKSNGKRDFRYCKIFNSYKDIIQTANATHLLCANFSGTEFEGLCKYWRLVTEKSVLKPENSSCSTSSRVTIYPLIGTPFGNKGEREPRLSRGLSDLIWSDGKVYKERQYNDGEVEYIQHLFNKATQHIGQNDKALLIKNTYRKFGIKNFKNMVEIAVDSRGMNSYTDYLNGVILFSNNPNPIQKKSFEDLEKLTGISKKEWEHRYLVSHTYEMSLQAATRTNIRLDEKSVLQVNLYVPDWHHAWYLQKTLPEARIDTGLIEHLELSDKKEVDGRCTSEASVLAVVDAHNENPTATHEQIAKLASVRSGRVISRQEVSKIRKRKGLKKSRAT